MNVTGWLSGIGSDDADDDSTRLKKSLLVLCSAPFMLAGAGWGAMYIAFGEMNAGLIPLSYALVSFISLINFSFTRRYRFFRFSQLMLILLLPFCLMISLGGYIIGSGVILWSILSPLGALLFNEEKQSLRWMIAFAGLIVTAGLIQPYLRSTNNLSPILITIFFVMNLLGVGSLVFFMVYHFVRQKNHFQLQSESLLLNILPEKIARILKTGQKTIAHEYHSASVLFADMVNFTSLANQLSPVEVVELLNKIYSHFDELVEKYHLEKIKTIGDCYMVVSGIPEPRLDHAEAIVALAIDIQNSLKSMTLGIDLKVSFRIGINSGPILAGIIGSKKFLYDVWGDTVNVASRMEMHGAEGQIQITQETYELIEELFECEYRGVIAVKGKGDMPVWIVLSKKSGTL